ncbi:MAG: hypothetical protein GPOALKHO_000801 [Sodalis sp.]|nr:MAG: hypothetical protein GPOALKHO_000801 [Sodalis sp.]
MQTEPPTPRNSSQIRGTSSAVTQSRAVAVQAGGNRGVSLKEALRPIQRHLVKPLLQRLVKRQHDFTDLLRGSLSVPTVG